MTARFEKAVAEAERARRWTRWWSRQGFKHVNHVLWTEWDPIGAGVPDDEYSSYASQLAGPLSDDAPAEEIAAILSRASSGMGLADPARDQAVAQRIVSWYARNKPDLDRELFACPVCAYQGLGVKPYEKWPPPQPVEELTPPYEDALGKPSYEVCPRCGYEFGNDDNPGTAPPKSFSDYRREWEADGRPWFQAS